MRVLIIGGTGLIGPSLIQEISAGFPKAQIFTVTRSGKSFFTEHSLKADRSQAAKMETVIKNVAPDILIDMVPFTAENAALTATQVRKINPDLPVIALSSIDVYAAYAKLHGTEEIDYQPCPINETMALRQNLGVEGKAYDKLDVERIYRETLENVTILRLPATYGWPDSSRIAHFLDPMLDRQRTITMSPKRANWKFSRCLNKNAAHAIFLSLEAEQKGLHIYNVAEETPHTEQDWCRKIAKYCCWYGKIGLIDDPAETLDFDQDFFVSTDKIRTELGYTEKYDPDEGLADTIRLYAHQRFQTPYKPSY